MDKDLDKILDECIERLARGESIEECVSRYPEHRDALIPLLEVALATRQAAREALYRPEAKARGLRRLTKALAEGGAPKRRRFALPPMPRVARPVAVGLAAVVLVVVAAGWTTAASADSAPGDALYFVKTTKERIVLLMPRSDMDRARLHVTLARVRGQEMRDLIMSGRIPDAERLLDRMHHHLNEFAAYTGIVVPVNPIEMPVAPARFGADNGIIQLRIRLEQDGQRLGMRLQVLTDRMPPDLKQRAERMRRLSDVRYRALVAALESRDSPAFRTFWRNETVRFRDR